MPLNFFLLPVIFAWIVILQGEKFKRKPLPNAVLGLMLGSGPVTQQSAILFWQDRV